MRGRGGGEGGRVTYFEAVRFVEVLGDVGADECERVGEAGGVGVDVVAFCWAEGGGVSGGLVKGGRGGGEGRKGLRAYSARCPFRTAFVPLCASALLFS